jgi:hypothetical protein
MVSSIIVFAWFCPDHKSNPKIGKRNAAQVKNRPPDAVRSAASVEQRCRLLEKNLRLGFRPGRRIK